MFAGFVNAPASRNALFHVTVPIVPPLLFLIQTVSRIPRSGLSGALIVNAVVFVALTKWAALVDMLKVIDAEYVSSNTPNPNFWMGIRSYHSGICVSDEPVPSAAVVW